LPLFGVVIEIHTDEMLSPHEMAALMLLNDCPDTSDLDRADVESLLKHELIALEEVSSNVRCLRITSVGLAVLTAVTRSKVEHDQSLRSNE
jgi:hypothetical protein